MDLEREKGFGTSGGRPCLVKGKDPYVSTIKIRQGGCLGHNDVEISEKLEEGASL